MKENTPIQQAIQYWTARREEAPTIQMEQAADFFLQYLNASLPAEKEFVGKCFDAGIDFSEGVDQPNKTVFINQLYPKS